jgi:hypothetical protein
LPTGAAAKGHKQTFDRQSTSSDGPVTFNNPQLTHSQFINLKCAKASLLNHQATNGDVPYCQCTNCDRAERCCA